MFQRKIREAANKSNAIIVGDHGESTAERQSEEIQEHARESVKCSEI